jgi:hypothetical protein
MNSGGADKNQRAMPIEIFGMNKPGYYHHDEHYHGDMYSLVYV